MSVSHTQSTDLPLNPRERLIAAVKHLDHVLPGQAPILNFVHHNTLHGYQHLPFTEALAAAEAITGIYGYLPDESFRALYASGRINDTDIDAVLAKQTEGLIDETLIETSNRAFRRREIWKIGLVYGIEATEPSRLQWQIEELDVLHRFQPDVPETARRQVLGSAPPPSTLPDQPHTESQAIFELWNSCLDRLGLPHSNLHPEELAKLSAPQAGETVAELAAGTAPGHLSTFMLHPMKQELLSHLQTCLDEIGTGTTFRSLLRNLTGQDILAEIRPHFIRFCASHLDEGLAAWHAPQRSQGLYAAWRNCSQQDLALSLNDLPGWREAWAELPQESVDAVIACLRDLEIPQAQWENYLKRVALELPGWSGLINWRHHRPGYPANTQAPCDLMDYLAIRLFLDRLWINRICRETWGIPGTLTQLGAYFQRNLSEFSVRTALFDNRLPESLASRAHQLIVQGWTEPGQRQQWRTLAATMWTLRKQSAIGQIADQAVSQSAWRLFRLAQHLGLSAPDIRGLTGEACNQLLAAVDELTPQKRGYLWLCAYERHYRQDLFNALAQNHGRGRWTRRERRPEAQLIFCMDDREESIRRHLEELDPAIETLGAAGFFGVPINWRGLDDQTVTPLCPVVVTPSHTVHEEPRPGEESLRTQHDHRKRLKASIGRVLNQEIRRNLLSSDLMIGALAPGALAVLIGKVFFPLRHNVLSCHAAQRWVPQVPTRLHISAPADSPPATPDNPRLGFTDAEQADRVAGLLRVVGLTSGFAPLVVLAGHGSISQNNPHLAAYDCGACSGRHGGPNARAFAAMANRREVRALLAERGILIPNDTWFLGSEHNTCNEDIIWYDLDELPHAFHTALDRLRRTLSQAVLLSAHERCRRFASAPRTPSLNQAMRHVVERSVDFSQARPELGHATNAAALIGRRSVTQGAFFDRRVFLISYDPTDDTDGRILEGILLAAGPVGAGINLEYYFSTVNNDRYGCGTKVPHNVTGLFAVMEGASSDLRTGLPRQMIEIHEAMRLQVVVEATEEVLATIYERQPPLRELIGNGWLLLSAIHPLTGAISVFEPDRGFIPWCQERESLPMVARSTDWYDGYIEPRPPVLIRQPELPEAS